MRIPIQGHPPRGTVIDGLGRGFLFDMLTDDTDDTQSSIPDLKMIRMRNTVVCEKRPPSVDDLLLDVPLDDGGPILERPEEGITPSQKAASAVEPIAVLREARARRASEIRRLFGGSSEAGTRLVVVLLASITGLALSLGVGYLFGVRLSPWVMMAICAAAGASSIAGFAFSAICGAALFHLLGQPVHIVEIMLMCSIAIQLLSVAALKNAIDIKYLSRFLLGGVVGLPVGVYLLTHVSHSLYMHFMGAFLIVYGIYMLVRRPFVIPYAGRLGDCAAGFLGGVTGGFAAFPGAFVTIWCGLKGWSKEKQRGIFQPYILIMQLLALAAIFLMQTAHAQSSGLDMQTFSYVPAALLGTWCGLAIFRRLSDMQFARSVNGLLIVSGIGLVS